MQKIGIVWPGELGAALGVALVRAGHLVLTATAGRSPRTMSRCELHGFEIQASLAALVGRADVIVSCVPPAAAVTTAQEIAAAWSTEASAALYIDANSIAPQTVTQVQHEIRHTGLLFADVAVHGTAQRLHDLAVLYASGPGAARAVELFAPVMQAENLGPRAGSASAFKMLLGSVSKSLAAMMLEVGCAAELQNVLPAFLRACDRFYPGVIPALERTLLSYPRHAARRADEMAQVAACFAGLGMQAEMAAAAGRVLAQLAGSSVCRPEPAAAHSIADLLAQVAAAGVQQRPVAIDSNPGSPAA